MSGPVLEVDGLVKHFDAGRGRRVHAVNGVSFSLAAGETLGLVGESGSGKSTIGRCVTRLLAPSGGRIRFLGQDITTLPEAACRPLRGQLQIVFQDPWSALNPRMRVGDLIAEPLLLHTPLSRGERRDRAAELARRVRLTGELLGRFPGELSGGQLQRVCIARAIATSPRVIVLDEPTSSLDLSVRAGILDLLAELRAETGTAMIFISHDLGTVKLICDRILVLYLGQVVEAAPAARLFADPAHPYAQALISAHLPADPAVAIRRHVLEGDVPSPIDLPPGCSFASRCPVAIPHCRVAAPSLAPIAEDPAHLAACLRIADGGNRIEALTHG